MSHSTTDNEDPDTPTHTSIPSLANLSIDSSDNDMDDLTVDDVTSPWKGGTFIIRNPKTKLVIGLSDGILGLFYQDTYQYQYSESCHWRCVENDRMWLGFCNAVSGTYIGHNNSGKFIATARNHKGWEYFCVRQHPDGGHVLLVKHRDGFLPMKADDEGELVVDSNRQEGTAWEFVWVGFNF